ncbi:ABC transporter substrate-binding protein [Actinopolymorpha pittospori]
MSAARSSGMERRDLLRWSGSTILGASLLSGCELLSTDPSDKKKGSGEGSNPDAKEAPALAALVKQGKLPPLAQRLPKSPVVVTPVKQVGQYGGTIRSATTSQSASQLLIVAREGLVEWAPGKTEVVPGLAESWDITEDGRVYTFHLREGARWSDGHPFTADDLVFYYEAILSNTVLTPVVPTWLTTGGKPVRIAKVDDHTVTFSFEAPHGLLLRYLAFRGALHGALLWPKHYLSQFHPDFTSKAKLDQQVKDSGYKDWMDFFLSRSTPAENPERPVMAAWRLTKAMTGGDTRAIAERNPYYWKVDTQGRQLPYVDRLVQERLDPEVITLRAINGELDLQFETVSLRDLPVLADSADKNGIRVLRWASDAPWIAMYMNQSDKDPVLRALMQNIDVRAGLSHALNRGELNKLLYSNAGGIRHPCAVPQDDYYLEGSGERFTEYDVAKANELLDRAGLDQRDAEGMRLRPDGRPLSLLITTFTYEYGGTVPSVDAYEIVRQHWQKVGVRATVQNVADTLWSERATSNLLDIPGYTVGGILWDVDPLWYVPTSRSTYWASGYGEWYETGGKQGMEPPEQFRKLQDLYDRMASEIDDQARLELGHQILRAHDENVWMIGTVTAPFAPVVASADLVNLLDEAVLSYRLHFSATSWMEQLAYRNPDEH